MPATNNNKVVLSDGTVLIDLTADTITPAALLEGYTAHDKSGALITGTAAGGGSEPELIASKTVTASTTSTSASIPNSLQ